MWASQNYIDYGRRTEQDGAKRLARSRAELLSTAWAAMNNVVHKHIAVRAEVIVAIRTSIATKRAHAFACGVSYSLQCGFEHKRTAVAARARIRRVLK